MIQKLKAKTLKKTDKTAHLSLAVDQNIRILASVDQPAGVEE